MNFAWNWVPSAYFWGWSIFFPVPLPTTRTISAITLDLNSSILTKNMLHCIVLCTTHPSAGKATITKSIFPNLLALEFNIIVAFVSVFFIGPLKLLLQPTQLCFWIPIMIINALWSVALFVQWNLKSVETASNLKSLTAWNTDKCACPWLITWAMN